jgi:hypothetical protein
MGAAAQGIVILSGHHLSWLAITSPMKNSAQLSKRTGHWPKPSWVDLKNLYYRETKSYSA